MLNGIDISHHNKYQVKQGLLNLNDHDFIIMKATEGISFKDPMMDDYIEMINDDKPIGFYHYARPEHNAAVAEAAHFCDTLGDRGNHALLALDWECDALRYPLTWALEWLKYVENVYHKKPLIYCSSWYTKKLSMILENGNGLWVAHYTNKDKPNVHTYPFYAIWQYTNKPYDKDKFNGDINQLLRYM